MHRRGVTAFLFLTGFEMADTSTSKFERRFLTSSGSALLGATIELCPQDGTYPDDALELTEHSTRKGWYYRDAVPMDEYKIYIDGSLYTQHIFHAENILSYIRSAFNDLLKIPSSTIEDESILLEDLNEEVRGLLTDRAHSIFLGRSESITPDISEHEISAANRFTIVITTIAAASDYTGEYNIDNITDGTDNQILVIRLGNSCPELIFTQDGNMSFSISSSRTLSPRQSLIMQYDADNKKWYEIANNF